MSKEKLIEAQQQQVAVRKRLEELAKKEPDIYKHLMEGKSIKTPISGSKKPEKEHTK